MEIVNTLLLIFLELTFIFVVMLLLFNQRKSIGDTPFYVTMGMLLVFGELLCGANLSFNGMEDFSFQIAPVVVMVPFMAAALLIYVTDGVLALQRLIIGALVTMGVFFYLGDLTRLQMRWITYSVTGNLPIEAFDVLLERTRRVMLAVVTGQLLAMFIIPISFSRLRNTGHRLLICCAGALIIALTIDALVYELFTGSGWILRWQALTSGLPVRMAAGGYLAILLTIYITRLGGEKELQQVKPLEILFAFLGSYGRSKLLEADILKWEGRYRMILENASEMIVIIDQAGNIRDANRAAEKMLGRATLAGRTLADFLTPPDQEKFNSALLRSSQEQMASPQFYVEFVNVENVNMHLALTITPFSLGSLDAFIVMGRDITEERNLESEKQRLNEELAHSQRLEALGQLAGGVAHDFNNNIHAILGHADLINFKGQLDDRTRKHLEKIVEIAEHSGELTTQLLGFARKGKYRESDFDLRILIQRTADLFMPGSKDIEFTVETADKPLLVRGDQIQLQQVLLNMLINARDALRLVNDRELQLTVSAFECRLDALPKAAAAPENLDAAASAILVTISDNGCGMDENTLKRVFEPFFTTKPVGQGTGMGMAMAYGTIHSHHGTIGVESAVNEGTQIYIVLPKVTD